MISRRRLLAGAAGALATGAAFPHQASAATTTKSSKVTHKPATPVDLTLPPPAMPSVLPAQFYPLESKQIVIYSPHPDDETLSLGMAIAEYVQSGFEVHLVLLSQGKTTKAIDSINGNVDINTSVASAFKGRHIPALEGYSALTQDQIGAARIREFQAAAGLLRIPLSQIHTQETYDGDLFTIENIKKIMTGYAEMFPKAMHMTMSTIDIHPQHRVAGEALRLVSLEKNIASSYAVSRTTWKRLLKRKLVYPASIPELHWIKPIPHNSNSVLNATLPYCAWNPYNGSFAIGYTSVTNQFENLRTERNGLYIASTPAVADVMVWLEIADEEIAPTGLLN